MRCGHSGKKIHTFLNLYKNTTLLLIELNIPGGKNESYLIYAVHVDKNWSDIKNKKEQEISGKVNVILNS